MAQVGPLFVPPLRELLSLHALSAAELTIAAAFAIVPGLTVAARRIRTARKEPP